MNLLPLIQKRSGYAYQQICRSDKNAIYSQDLGTGQFSYDVFKIKIKSPDVVFSNDFEQKEVFPVNEDFGTIERKEYGMTKKTTAWRFGNLEEAKKKYDELEYKDGLKERKRLRNGSTV